jgi:hypothetical protein
MQLFSVEQQHSQESDALVAAFTTFKVNKLQPPHNFSNYFFPCKLKLIAEFATVFCNSG